MSVTPIQTSVGTLGLLRAHVTKDKKSILAELRYSVSEQGVSVDGSTRTIKTRTYLVASYPHLGTWRVHFVGGDGSASSRVYASRSNALPTLVEEFEPTSSNIDLFFNNAGFDRAVSEALKRSTVPQMAEDDAPDTSHVDAIEAEAKW